MRLLGKVDALDLAVKFLRRGDVLSFPGSDADQDEV